MMFVERFVGVLAHFRVVAEIGIEHRFLDLVMRPHIELELAEELKPGFFRTRRRRLQLLHHVAGVVVVFLDAFIDVHRSLREGVGE